MNIFYLAVGLILVVNAVILAGLILSSPIMLYKKYREAKSEKEELSKKDLTDY